MPTIVIRNEEGIEIEREVVSRRVVIAEFDPEGAVLVEDNLEPILEPAVPQRVEWDDEGGQSSITTVCGETENRRSSDNGASYVVEGIITEDQLSAAKSISRGDNLTLISDVHKGPIMVKRVTIEQNTDIIEFREGGTSKLAFAFQMQFKQPDSTGGTID